MSRVIGRQLSAGARQDEVDQRIGHNTDHHRHKDRPAEGPSKAKPEHDEREGAKITNDIEGVARQPSLAKVLESEGWRRERDSNPRNRFRFSGFQDHRHRPLGHPSALKLRLNSRGSQMVGSQTSHVSPEV